MSVLGGGVFSMGDIVNTELHKKESKTSLGGLKIHKSLEMHDGFESTSSCG